MIKAMWGLCDGIEILFHETAAGLWETEVPADFNDGMYVVEIWLETQTHSIVYKSAILYMCDSKCVSLEFVEDGVDVEISLIQDMLQMDDITVGIQMLEDVAYSEEVTVGMVIL